MDINRRSLLGAGVAGTGLLTAGIPQLATATAAPGTTDPAGYFGPVGGQALLSRNENPFGPAPSALAAMSECSGKACYYADRALTRMTAMIAERHGVTPDMVVMGSGSTEVLCAAVLAWGRKGKVLAPELFWDTTLLYGERQGVASQRVPLGPDMGIDLAAMQAAVADGVSLVHLCNPNNPTGMILPPAALRAFAAAITPKATLLVDEAYNELTDRPDDNTLIDLVKAGNDIIVCRTFSKIYGMAGMRLGYAITTPANVKLLQSHIMSLALSSNALAAAMGSYNDTGFLTRSKSAVIEARGMIYDAVQKAGLRALPSQANFVYVEVPDADAVQKAMAARNIDIRGTYGKWKQYSRVSTGKLEDVRRYAMALPEVAGAMKA